jgi:hypothetical protein
MPRAARRLEDVRERWIGMAMGMASEGSPRFFVAREFPLGAGGCGVHEDPAIGYEGAAPWS